MRLPSAKAESAQIEFGLNLKLERLNPSLHADLGESISVLQCNYRIQRPRIVLQSKTPGYKATRTADFGLGVAASRRRDIALFMDPHSFWVVFGLATARNTTGHSPIANASAAHGATEPMIRLLAAATQAVGCALQRAIAATPGLRLHPDYTRCSAHETY